MSKGIPNFDDPLQDIDPIMEQAFSVSAGSSVMMQDEIQFPTQEPPTLTRPMASVDSAPHLPISQKGPSVAQVQFPSLQPEERGLGFEEDLFNNIPVKVSVELGRSNMSLKEVYELTEGSIVELERMVGEPLDLVINGQIIAQGEVVAIDNKYGLRIKALVVTPARAR